MKPTKRNYANLTAICERLGLVPYKVEGWYTFKGTNASIDLTACGENEMSILKTAVEQLSKQVDTFPQSVSFIPNF